MGEEPETLILAEAMRYTNVPLSSFTLDCVPVAENPAATEAYKSIGPSPLENGANAFTARFADLADGRACLARAMAEKGGRWTHLMKTDAGLRKHTLDIRMTRHPLTGDNLFQVAEYDVTDLQEALDAARDAQDRLRRMAHYDALTGLPSQHLFRETGATLLARAGRNFLKVAVMFVDLDGFKAVNDTWGHDAGDRVLKAVADRLKGCLRESDQVARIGGDEFVVLVPDLARKEDAGAIARKIVDDVCRPISIPGPDGETRATVGASVGVAFYPDHGKDMETLLKVADHCMYQAKAAGKGDIRLA